MKTYKIELTVEQYNTLTDCLCFAIRQEAEFAKEANNLLNEVMEQIDNN